MVASSKVSAQNGKATAQNEHECEAVTHQRVQCKQYEPARWRCVDLLAFARRHLGCDFTVFAAIPSSLFCSFCRRAYDRCVYIYICIIHIHTHTHVCTYAWAQSDLKLMSGYHRFLQTSRTLCKTTDNLAGRRVALFSS